MLDEIVQQNALKFAIFMEYENPNRFLRFSFRATLDFLTVDALVYVYDSQKSKATQNEKKKKKFGFSYFKNMANFEAFCQTISSSINLLFLKSANIALYIIYPSKKKIASTRSNNTSINYFALFTPNRKLKNFTKTSQNKTYRTWFRCQFHYKFPKKFQYKFQQVRIMP